MQRDTVGRPTIRAVLFLGFGLTVGLWLLAGYGFARKVAEVEGNAAAINARYLQAQLLIAAIRSRILLASVFVRDALLDDDPAGLAAYRREVGNAFARVDDQMRRYRPVVDSEAERIRVAELQQAITDFKATALAVFAERDRQASSRARLELSRRIVGKREAVVRVSERNQAMNRAAFVQRQTELAAATARIQRRAWEQLGLSLLGSLAIALVAAGYAGRLERRLRLQQARDLQLTNDLQRLSAKLVDAQEDERRSIARELHDEVGQALTALRMELDSAQRRLQGPGAADHVTQAQAIAETALRNVRDLSRLLHPALLDDLGLPAALESHLRGFETRHGVPVQLHVEGMEHRLPGRTEAALYRIVQEALTNVAKHARAASCRVSLVRCGDAAVLTVEDDGAGFDLTSTAAPDATRGLGLIGIRERVVQMGGTFAIDSAPGQGTRLTVRIPMQSRARVVLSAGEDAATVTERLPAGGALHG